MKTTLNNAIKLAQKIEIKWAKPRRYDMVEAFIQSMVAFKTLKTHPNS